MGYAGATMDRIAAAAGVAKATLYRRWPSKGTLITDCLVDAFGPPDALGPSGQLPLTGRTRDEFVCQMIGWFAGRLREPGLGPAFAGVFVDAVSDAALREVLATRFQAPYLRVFREVLGEPEDRVLLVFDLVAGTMLHRMGMTGAPMAEADVAALVWMVQQYLRDGGGAG